MLLLQIRERVEGLLSSTAVSACTPLALSCMWCQHALVPPSAPSGDPSFTFAGGSHNGAQTPTNKRKSTAGVRADATFRKVAIKWQEQRKSALLQQQSFSADEPSTRLSVIRQPLTHVATAFRRWVSGNGEAPQQGGDGVGTHAAIAADGGAVAPGNAAPADRQHSDARLSDGLSRHSSGADSLDEVRCEPVSCGTAVLQ